MTVNPWQRASQTAQSDHETGLIATLYEALRRNDTRVNQDDIANLFVALKSRPLVILAGPSRSGKTALVRSLAQSLVERDSLRVQIFSGHPWWAERCDGVAYHTRLHARFSTEKILSLIDEALQPGNSHQVFIACLTHITPAELLSFFTEVSFQLQNGQIMRLGDTHLTRPIPFPANLRMIGTMDTDAFDWWDDDLLLSTTVIQSSRAGISPNAGYDQGVLLEGSEFLQSCIRGREAAYHKICPVLMQQHQPLFPLLQVKTILKRYISSLDSVVDDVMIYLANSWSQLGNGLFHPSPDRNLAIALDLAIAQFLLPRAAEAIRYVEELRMRLKYVLGDELLHSAAFVTALDAQG